MEERQNDFEFLISDLKIPSNSAQINKSLLENKEITNRADLFRSIDEKHFNSYLSRMMDEGKLEMVMDKYDSARIDPKDGKIILTVRNDNIKLKEEKIKACLKLICQVLATIRGARNPLDLSELLYKKISVFE